MKYNGVLLGCNAGQLTDKYCEVTEEYELQSCDMDEIHQGIVELNDVMKIHGIISDDYKTF
ncbi:hypothetical protein K8N77_000240 [Salmonella enterica]|uniref:hypothetical protein n=1 Tax=Citrobacter portucalensis TaxID=1639133 RepID=UPI003B26B0D3|nr:hypothetical protein [Salmonella enterica]